MFQDDESCHDYADDFHDDFDDQPTTSDRVCDNTREKAVLFDLSVSDTETMVGVFWLVISINMWYAC